MGFLRMKINKGMNMKKYLLAILLLIMAFPAFATVSTETTRVAYTCNGTSTTYAYTFKILADADLKVIKTLTATGAETTLTLATDYTVTGAGTASGNVVLTAGSKCASGYTMTILRDMDVTQETDYVDGEAFSAESIESALDKNTMILQQLKEEVGRAPKLPTTSTITDIALPNPTANHYIGWNTTGTNLTNISNPVATTATQYEIDALVTYGGGTAYTQATIESALTAIGTTNKATLLLRPGNWVILTALAFPANVEVKMPSGAYFSGAAVTAGTITGLKEATPDMFGVNTSPGTTDMTAAVSAALASATTLIIPESTYLCGAAALKNGMTIEGKGFSSILKLKTGSTTWFAGNDITNFTAHHVKFDGNSVASILGALVFDRSAGSGAKINIHDCWFANIGVNSAGVYVLGDYTGINVHHNIFDGVSTVGVSSTGVGIGLEWRTVGANYPIKFNINNNYFKQLPSGVHIGGARDGVISNNFFDTCGNATDARASLVLYCGDGTAGSAPVLQDISVIGNVISGSLSFGIYAAGNPAVYATTVGINRVSIIGNIIRSPANVGIEIIDGMNNCDISNNIISASGDDGIELQRATAVAAANNTYNRIQNNTITAAGAKGIHLNAYANNNEISGNIIYNPTINGIDLDANADSNRVVDNVFAAGGTAIVDGGTSNIIARNTGWVTENASIGTIINGSTSVTITHGLQKTPSLGDITITWGEASTNPPGLWWVDNIGAATFQVNVTADPGENLDFGWSAK